MIHQVEPCQPTATIRRIADWIHASSPTDQDHPKEKINLDRKLSLFDETWTPKIIGALNGQPVKLAKLEGEFLWHQHEHEDELFLVLEGRLTLRFRDREVHLEKGEMLIVPAGVEHQPAAVEGTSVLLFEPSGTEHTGNTISERKVTDQEWI